MFGRRRALIGPTYKAWEDADMGHWLDNIVFPSSWIDVRGHSFQDADSRDRIATELRREIGRKHVLRPTPWRVVAAWRPQDDVLLALNDDRAAIVHLTHGRHPEPPPWPSTEILTTPNDLEAAFRERDALMDDED